MDPHLSDVWDVPERWSEYVRQYETILFWFIPHRSSNAALQLPPHRLSLTHIKSPILFEIQPNDSSKKSEIYLPFYNLPLLPCFHMYSNS